MPDQMNSQTASLLEPEQLYRACPTAWLDFSDTNDLEPLDLPLGQERAVEALRFGAAMRHEGFNLFVTGEPGTGRHGLTRRLLDDLGPAHAELSDWCYVSNFDTPHRPKALRLPKGQGRALQAALREMAGELLSSLPAAFDNETYRSQVQQLDAEFKQREEQAFNRIRDAAMEQNIAVLQTPMGYTLAPSRDGEVMDPAAFEALPEDEQKRIEENTRKIRERLSAMLRESGQWQREHAQRRKQLDSQVSQRIAEQSMQPLLTRFADNPDVRDFLEQVQIDIGESADDIRKFAAEHPRLPRNGEHLTPLTPYDVNLLVDNSRQDSTPVIYEDHPSYQNLIGRIDHVAQFGTLQTNFMLIKPGALHQANGGFLILDARKLLQQPFVWDALKRALLARELRIESVERMLSLASTITLEPEVMPLSIKIVLVGERLLYHLLSAYDPEFNRLFKIQADFAEDVARSEENSRLYARLIASQLREDQLLPADRGAVARLIEQAAREAGDGHRLSLRNEDLLDLQREADHLARQQQAVCMSAEHIEKAVVARRERAARIPDRLRDSVLDGVHRIDTSGERVARINGLSIIQLGEQRFGHPTRISATARVGDGTLLDIEREVKLGEPVHSKGVLILGSHLAERYAGDEPLSLSASLVFEQSYGRIDGDSASVAELCALLSALSQLPLRQDLAVTGSVNQHGDVQAIGGVNEKIEGFFEICQARGLTGSQGVIIPQANVRHLMLRADVREAAADKRFRIYSASRVDQVITLLTGRTAGTRDADGNFPADSVNGRVQRRLRELGRHRQTFSHPGRQHEQES